MANNDPVLIPYVIQEGSLWYVAYKEKNPFVPEITVSAKGIANHTSEEINDGADFGPDTYNPSVTSGVPLTQTSGLQEAYNYVFINGGLTAFVLPGNYLIDVPLLINSLSIPNVSTEIFSASMIGSARTYGLTTIQISDNFDVSSNTVMIYIGTGAHPFQGEFSNININGIAPNGNRVQTGIYVGNIFGATISGIANQINQNPANYLIYQLGSNSATGNAPLIKNINAYGCSLYFEPNAECFYSNISQTFYSIPFTIGCTGNGGDTGPTLTNLNLWNPNVNNSGAGAIQLLGGAGTTTILNNVAIHNPYNSTVIVDLSKAGGGFFVINGLASESTPIGTLVNWDDNTNTGVNLTITGINIHMDPSYPLLDMATNNTTPFTIKVVGGIIYSGSIPDLVNESISAGQLFEVDDVVVSNGSDTPLTPSISTNPPASATVYQNNTPYDIIIYLPAYASTAGTAGYVTLAKGPTSSVSTIGNQYVSGDTSDSSEQIIPLTVPAGWYYEFVTSGTTLGTAVVQAV